MKIRDQSQFYQLLVEKEVLHQLYGYLNEKSLLPEFQLGFRPLYSTTSALIQMCDNWFKDMDNGELTGVVFLDICKAFDSINNSILLDKMKMFGISGLELSWFTSYLTNRQQRLVNNQLSTAKEMICVIH